MNKDEKCLLSKTPINLLSLKKIIKLNKKEIVSRSKNNDIIWVMCS